MTPWLRSSQQRGDRGGEVDGDAPRQQAVPLHLDPEAVARRAAVAVGGDDVPRADLALLAGVEVPQRGGDPVVVLLERDDLGAVAQVGPELERLLPQDRLEHVLVQEQPRRGRQPLDALVEVGDVDRVLLAGQRLDGVDAAARVVHAQRRLAGALLEPRLAQDLHRADLEVTGARVDGGAGVALGGDRADAVAAEQHRGRQADQAAADDQDWCLLSMGRDASPRRVHVATESRDVHDSRKQ